jgi:hypothetical protein
VNINFGGAADRRSGRDRRRNRFPTLKGLLLHRRRSDLRRRTDRNRIVLLDRYSNTALWAIVLVLVLSITDGFLTLFLIRNGAVELNPVMDFFLRIGPLAFMGSKYLFTAGSVFIVVVLNYTFMRRFKIYARELIKYFVAVFGVVICWEIYLVFRYVL